MTVVVKRQTLEQDPQFLNPKSTRSKMGIKNKYWFHKPDEAQTNS